LELGLSVLIMSTFSGRGKG